MDFDHHDAFDVLIGTGTLRRSTLNPCTIADPLPLGDIARCERWTTPSTCKNTICTQRRQAGTDLGRTGAQSGLCFADLKILRLRLAPSVITTPTAL